MYLYVVNASEFNAFFIMKIVEVPGWQQFKSEWEAIQLVLCLVAVVFVYANPTGPNLPTLKIKKIDNKSRVETSIM